MYGRLSFVAETHRHSAVAADGEHEAEDQASVDAISLEWANASGATW